MCVQAPSPCALDRTAAWLLNMNSASSYGDAEEDRQEDSLIEKVSGAFPLHLARMEKDGSGRLNLCAWF